MTTLANNPFNRSVHTDTQQQIAAARRLLRAGPSNVDSASQATA